MPFKILKDTNPVEVLEFVDARGISDEPTFLWWVSFNIKKRNRIISAANSIVSNKTHKFVIEVPMSIFHAKQWDANNGDTLWQDAISKEMYPVLVAFKIWEEGESPPPG